jgi:hypothetical protein
VKDATLDGRGVSPGALALHGGGEFLSGDEAFLRACLEAAEVERPRASS